ncbi:MAG: dTMP kinase [Candidatus Omnitrophica bacterium]|nr:dTMP kinase [Candidatus Omnitrophota bacterium]
MAKKTLKRKALFITFEGGERTGKSTHIKFLAKLLRKRGLSVKRFREPGSTKLSEQIRKVLLYSKRGIAPETELFLYCAARAQFVKEELFKALKKYKVVICDRFSDSTLVYQGYALGLGIKKISTVVKLACQGIKPDLTFVLDVAPKKALLRIKRKKDRIERRPLKFHEALRKGYRVLAKKEPKRIKIIKADGDKARTHKQIAEVVNLKIKPCRKKICQ